MYEYKVKSVERIVDGDTVDIIIDLGFGLFKKERCRLEGIDTPEKRTRDLREKRLGVDATEYVEKWFANEDGKYQDDIVVRTSKDGKYGRMLAKFHRRETAFPCSDCCLNYVLIDDGYALPYDGGTKHDMSEDSTLMQMLSKRGYESWDDYSEQNND